MKFIRFVLLISGLALLAVGIVLRLGYRHFEQYQKWPQSVVGGMADVSGVTTLYAGITGRDLATMHHLGLSTPQQRGMITTGSLWILAVLVLLYVAVHDGIRFWGSRRGKNEKGP